MIQVTQNSVASNSHLFCPQEDPLDDLGQQHQHVRSGQGQVKDRSSPESPRQQVEHQHSQLQERAGPDENSGDETDEYDVKAERQTSRDGAALQRHRRSERRKSVTKSERVEDCPDCSLAFASSADLDLRRKTHKKTRAKKPHQSKPQYFCPSCHKAFKYRAAFNTHLRQHGSGDPGLTVLRDRADILETEHGSDNAGLNVLRCRADTLGTKHGSDDAELNVLKCRADTSGAKHGSKLSMPHQCGTCQQRFSSARGVKGHMRRAHSDGKASASGECARRFKDPNHLNAHLNKFCRKPQPSPCGEPQEAFLEPSDRKAHADARSPGAGDVSGKGHKMDAPGLADRVADPRQETEPPLPPPKRRRGRPPKSENPKDACPSNGQRKERAPVTCPQCGTKVSRARDLKIHVRVHTGEMPYTCSECGKPFRHRASYNLHVKLKCDGKPYSGKPPRVNTHKHQQATGAGCESDTIKSEPADGRPEHLLGVDVGKVDSVRPGAGDGVKTEVEERAVCLGEGLEENHLRLEELDAAQQHKLQQRIQVGDQHHFLQQQEQQQQQQPHPNHEKPHSLIIHDHQGPFHQSQFPQQQDGSQGDASQGRNPEQGVQENGHQRESPPKQPVQLQTPRLPQEEEDPRSSHQLFSHRPRGRRPINPNACVACHVCGVKISRQRDLKIHMRIHSGEKPYLCSECGEEFRQAAGLVAHNIRKHSGQRPYVCDQCGAAFPLVGSLNQHMRIHNDVKRYTCDQCGKSFLRSSDLKGHIARHLGIKRFSCRDCGKTFSTSSELSKHRTLHTGEKPHVCSECRRAFRLQKSLKRHMRTHLKDRGSAHCADCSEALSTAEPCAEHGLMTQARGNVSVFSCRDCGVGFFDAGSLLRHQHEAHGWGISSSQPVQNTDGFALLCMSGSSSS